MKNQDEFTKVFGTMENIVVPKKIDEDAIHVGSSNPFVWFPGIGVIPKKESEEMGT